MGHRSIYSGSREILAPANRPRDTRPGFQRIPNGLPRLSTFMTLSVVDLTMAHNRDQTLNGEDFKLLVAARNVAKHEVPSLLVRESLRDIEECGARKALYECCRLATILYANAIIFPTLEDFPGIQEPVRQLRQLLQLCDFAQWKEDVSAVVLWLLFVGGIGAYRSPRWMFFVSALRDSIARCSVSSLGTIKPVLRQFV